MSSIGKDSPTDAPIMANIGQAEVKLHKNNYMKLFSTVKAALITVDWSIRRTVTITNHAVHNARHPRR